MIAGTPVLDLDDVASLEAADSGGTLRSAASGGAQVRATAAAIGEDALARLGGLRPRSVVLVSGAGRAARAAALLVAALGDRAGLPIVPVTAIPQWVGPLDVVLVAGDDAGDPRLIGAVDRALKRGAEVVIATPDEGPLRAAAAGRAAMLPPRVRVLEHNRLLRFLAVGIAVLRAVDPSHIGPLVPDLDALADVLDAEAMRDGPHNEVFHNPAKTLAARMQERRIVLSGDSPAAAEVAGHGAEVLLQAAGQIAAAAHLADAVAANSRMSEAANVAAPGYDPLFHDEQLDGPAPVDRVRVFVVSAETDQVAAGRRLAVFGASAGLVDADLVNVDVGLMSTEATVPRDPETLVSETVPEQQPGPGRGGELEQLAVLILRLEMAAAYLRLLGGPSAGSDRPAHYDGGHY
ncbi:tobH protein [Nocardia transvalensis]|uniref:tobH protein n=1 Tax=Nocardia transvalensis TaxID=37333 RepID=UPI001892DDE5|nr:tobH protein [Nocardia transvalensis]MBF6327182.1 tobH protein [Nocardia transvalensis]